MPRFVPRLWILGLILFFPPLWPAAAAAQTAPHEEPPAETDPFPGSYRVRGLTTDIRSGDTRRIEGIIVLDQRREGFYAMKSDLETRYPSEGGPVDTHVIGTGTGRPSGDQVVGTAEIQLVLGTVPGLGAEFAFAPRVVGPRLLSTWTAGFRRDGTLVIDVENRGAPGEDYSPTRTRLYATRIPERAGKVPAPVDPEF